MQASLHLGDCRDVLRELPENSIDSCVDDAPYGLNDRIDARAMITAWLAGERYEPKGSGFMGCAWDKCVPGPDTWREVYRVLKPGAHLLVFAGSKTVGLTEMAIRLAGFEIRDQMQWLYGQGMPKSHDISMALDKRAGAEREVVGPRISRGDNRPYARKPGTASTYNTDNGDVRGGMRPPITSPATAEAKKWDGWGSALKPAHEPIVVARKPLDKGLTLAENVLRWGTGALNVDGCRLEAGEVRCATMGAIGGYGGSSPGAGYQIGAGRTYTTLGRWPANILVDTEAAALIDAQSGNRPGMSSGGKHRADYEGGMFGGIDGNERHHRGDKGGASRFFYQPKAIRREKDAGLQGLDWLPGGRNPHNTVKPIELIRYLQRLVTAPGGVTLDAHMGSGTAGIAAKLEGFEFIGIEWEELSFRVAQARIAWWSRERVEELGFEEAQLADPRQTSLFDFDTSEAS